MRSLLQRVALALGAVVGLLGTRPATANAQKALVYCPVSVDATGCNAIVTALTGPMYPLGVDRGFDGTGGTVDLKTVDLFSYSVFVVPSLADDATSQPYATLRDPEVVEHLKAALIGRIAMWSGSPDQGATNRTMKDALIQNLAAWASGAYGTAKGPGLVALLDVSASTAARYDWVRTITPVPVTADGNLLIYNSVRSLDPRATAILTSGAGPIVYDNMATFGFAVPNGAPGVSLDAVGQTGTSQGGQVVLLTMEAGNAAGATVKTDKADYPPGTTVVITGSGWQAGETVNLTLHMDPLRDADTQLTATADGNGSFTNTQFAPGDYDVGVRFVLTAVGEASGRRAQTTFTDGTVSAATIVLKGGPPGCAGAAPSPVNVGTTICATGSVTVQGGGTGDYVVKWIASASATGTPVHELAVANATNGSTYVDTFAPNTSGTWTIVICKTANVGACAGGNVVQSLQFTVGGNTPPVAANDSYSTNEDAPLTVTALGTPNGVLFNDTDADGNTLTAVRPAGSTGPSNGVLSLNPDGSFTYTPNANFNGTDSFTYKAFDGTVNSAAFATVTITVNPVNDAPSFTKGANQTVLEDAAPQTVAGWATAISAGPTPDEASQTLAFTTSNDNNALFTVQPAIAPNGTLTYTPAANAFGVATVTVTLKDDGGTANAGVDTSAPQTFTITITGVNDAPSFTKGADQSLVEDAGAQSVPGWATAISSGPANESSQTVSFEITGNTNAALFSGAPAVSSNGTLTFTPSPNASGSATVTLRAKDDGGTANGGVDVSPTQTFTITVAPVNDAPTFTKGADQTVMEDAGSQTVAGWATNISKGPADESSQSLTFSVTGNTNPTLFSAAPAVDPATGTLTYTAAPNAFGTATITLELKDDGGTANGGVNSSTQTFVINVTAVNDAPSFVKGSDQTVLEDAGAQSVSGWATAISAGPLETQTVDFIVSADNTALFSTQPAIDATGKLTYTPAANANGLATITVRIHDDGGTANGGVDASAPQTFKITVTAVNDAPSFTRGADQTVLEDATAQTVAGWATNPSAGPADEESQALNFVVTNDNNGLFSVQPSVAADGTLTYTPAANAYGSATVTVKLHDDGGTANGGVDTSVPQTFTVTVTPVNDAPSFVKGPDQTVNEDASAQSVPNWATSISAGPNEASQLVDFVVSNDNTALFSAQPTVDATGKLTYTPTPNANGSATVTIHIHDDGGTANGGVDASANQTFTITVRSVNDAPSFTKGDDQTVNEDAGAQTVASWATGISAGPADESGQTVTFMVSNNNTALFSGQPSISPTGTLTYTPAPDAYGTAIVTVKLQDNGGTAYGGIDMSAEQTFTITVNAVNDAPSFTKGADQTINEDVGAISVANWATNISVGPANESSQTISFLVTGNSNSALFSAQPAVGANGTLTYTPAADAFGTATITLIAKDNGGTANSGVDTSAPQTFTITINSVNDAPTFDLIASDNVLEDAAARTVPNALTNKSAGPANESGQVLSVTVTNNNTTLFSAQPAINLSTGELTYTPAPNANGTATVTVALKDNGGTANGGSDETIKTLVVTVTPVNDAPSFTKGANQTSLEDAGAQTLAAWATNVSAGPTDEAGQALNFVVTNDNNALFSVQPAVDAAGQLTYTAAPNANGFATVTIRLHDNGGTANGGSDTSPTETFTITVTAVNDAPSFTKGADQTVPEDAAAQTLGGWATAISAGPADESGQALNFSVTNTDNNLFSVQPAIGPNGDLTYTPAPNAFGTATVTVVIHDNGGTANTGVDTSAPQTFTITLTPVNDAPSFTKGADQTVLEDAGAQTLAGWATSISAGPANESSQTVTFLVSNNNSSLFAVAPAVAPNGTLTYTPAANANGTATITIAIKDNGGTADGGVDTSPTQTFTINVTAVNDAPTFVKGADQTVLEDAGAQSVPNWATAISAGPADESGQALTFTASSTNDALFAVMPAVDPTTGALTYTLAPNANGSATVTVKLKDNGGTANGGMDYSSQTFTITVTAVNDAPGFTKGADQTSLEDAGSQTVTPWATNVSAGPPDEATQTLTFLVSNDNNGLFADQPAIDATGKLTYKAAPNANGTATVTVSLKDDGGTANGGVDTFGPVTFTITITAVNDAPTFAKGADQTVLEDAGIQSVSGWATGMTAGPSDEAGQTLAFNVTGNTNPALFSTPPAIDPLTGTLTYTPAPNANGSATITLTLKDNGGTANGGVDTSVPQTFVITVKPVNDVPSFVKGANQGVLEDAGAQTIGNWATSISAGPANESSQSVSFLVSNDNSSLFAVAPTVAPNGTLTYTPAPNANGIATVTIAIKDDGGTDDGGVDTSPTQTFTITVTAVNDAPTYDLLTSTQSAEDAGPQTVSSALTNPSVGPANEAAQTFLPIVVTNNNNALFSAQPSIDQGTGKLTYTAAPNANGTATVTVTVKDNGGTANGGVDATTKAFTITITKVNDAPVINAFSGPIAPSAVNTPISVSGNFTDVDLGDIPLTESHTLTIDWGDASTSSPTPTGTGTTRSVAATHTYASAGVYTVKLTVKDAGGLTDDEIYQYVVVYDASAGFVTGGGWIDSPAGACKTSICTNLTTGKANFGFVSKYKKGANVPDGNTEFQFKAGDINFHSEIYEWLVVSGARAQFKGTGSINGSGNYGFILTAIDGQISGGGGTDKFRIKIWDKNNGDMVVYDNQMLAADDATLTTVLGGGSINIQAK
jgi:VCBS repeat-containing protein